MLLDNFLRPNFRLPARIIGRQTVEDKWREADCFTVVVEDGGAVAVDTVGNFLLTTDIEGDILERLRSPPPRL